MATCTRPWPLPTKFGRRGADAQFLYVGHRDKLDAWVVPEQGYPIRFVRARPFPRTRSLVPLLRFAIALAVGVVQGALILLRYRPQIIISTGGFVSAPILFAHGAMAKVGLSRARVFLYEPNAYPGLLNQITGRLAQRIGVAFEQAGRWFDAKKVAVVGYPVRRSFLHLDRLAAREKLGIDQGRKVVLAFGGSGGAKAINEAVLESLPPWQAAGLVVIHVTGRYKGSDYDAVADTEAALAEMGIEGEGDWYRRLDYADEIADLIAAADMVICRSGAGTLTEDGGQWDSHADCAVADIGRRPSGSERAGDGADRGCSGTLSGSVLGQCLHPQRTGR